ncbi:RpiB/LacA/LacB family sugar-phosphate isomerase [Alicyclobacillus shizuokensis]|uniref:RpiB/LacA/LacB family sugar-phosphate isomerase n=1 Tax=Alicyclobacillus shizuokensis TaxID=392014 RepID=UPI0009F84894|nr:RpiB/LacA/LacB family sugar-phosphate isomerase [Alicyclobacillus shizuokensis]
MKIAFGNDHAGAGLRDFLCVHLQECGHKLTDCGIRSVEPVDFPDIVEKVCGLVLDGTCDRGVIVCGTGVGATIAANKFRGIRAALCHDAHSAHQCVEHDNCNVLCLGAQIIGPWLAQDIIDRYLAARYVEMLPFSRRLAKVRAIEEGQRVAPES